MRINTNITAIMANSHLQKNDNALGKSLERLSSGLKLNRSADNSAGMAISAKMRAQIKGLDQANNNASDGVSVIQSAEGALGEVHSMLQRMRELAVQGANGTNTDEDRDAIQKEMEALQEEIDRIGTDTEFNNRPLLDGTWDRRRYPDTVGVNVTEISNSVQAGDYKLTIIQGAEQATTTLTATNTTANLTDKVGAKGKIVINGYDIPIKEDDTKADVLAKITEAADRLNLEVEFQNNYQSIKLTSYEYGSEQEIMVYCEDESYVPAFGLSSNNTNYSDEAKITLTGNTTGNTTASGTISINVRNKDTNQVETVNIPINAGDTKEDILKNITTQIDTLNATEQKININYDKDNITFTSYEGNASAIPGNGSKYEVSVTCTNCLVPAQDGKIQEMFGFPIEKETVQGKNMEADFTINGDRVGFSNTAILSAQGNKLTITDQGGFRMEYEIENGVLGEVGVEVMDIGTMTIHVGANEGQIIDVCIPEVSKEALGLTYLNCRSQFGCEKAISLLDDAISKISSIRSSLGAYQNRMDTAMSSLSVTHENMTAAISRLEDTDMSSEMTEYTKYTVLQQAATAMVAQANERPQTVLQLLQ